MHKYLENFSDSITLVGPFASKKNFMEPVIFIDSGTQYKTDVGISLGDNDSFDGELNIKLNPHKNFSDLAYALKNIPSRFTIINLLGFLGGRRDHELFNLGEVSLFLKQRDMTTVFFDTEIIAYSAGKWEFELNQTFSLFSFEENQVTLTGNCKYPLENQKITGYDSFTLSNEANGSIELKNSTPILILK